MPRITTLLLSFGLLFCLNAVGKEIDLSIGKAHQHLLESRLLKQVRPLVIHLPQDYANQTTRYPVLYLLDGERHLNHAILASNLLVEENMMPAHITVSIPNVEGMRSQNLSRERHTFAEFIEHELMPYINRSYRTSGINTLYGHSLAGYFTMHMLSHRPALFDKYIAASPALSANNSEVITEFTRLINKKETPNKTVYFSLASQLEEGKNTSSAMQDFIALLNDSAPNRLIWKYDFAAEQTHISNYYPSLYKGLIHVFKDYQPPAIQHAQDYLQQGGLAGLKTYYKKRAKRYQMSSDIPQARQIRLANLLIDESRPALALELYHNLIQSHPDSARAYSGLGQVYSQMNDHSKAIAAHQKAVSLSSDMATDWQAFFKRRLAQARQNAQQ